MAGKMMIELAQVAKSLHIRVSTITADYPCARVELRRLRSQIEQCVATVALRC
jgi:hypothetical protein